jgi:hypothetical protein
MIPNGIMDGSGASMGKIRNPFTLTNGSIGLAPMSIDQLNEW